MTIPVRQCIRQAQCGDTSGIDDVCRAYGPLIETMSRRYRYLYGTLGEARAEATLAVIEGIFLFDLNGTDTVARALTARVRNNFRCQAYRVRRDNRYLDRMLRDGSGATDIPSHLEDDRALQPEDHVVRLEDAARLQEALATLDEKERLLLCQRIQEQRTFRDLGESYGYPIPTVQGIVRRAMIKLRRYYGVELN